MKMIVIEGLDGSGKTTQTDLLMQKLLSEDKPFLKIKLPDYESDSSALVKMYLNGDFGSDPKDVNAYAASAFYAVDRYANYKCKWAEDYKNGKLIIADRYTTSNAIHQMTKLPKDEWDSFLSWLSDFEYIKLELPEPDLVIFLDMPVDISQKLMSKRYHGNEQKKDVHERNTEYLYKCEEAAHYASEKLGWKTINCSLGNEARSIDEIAKDINFAVFGQEEK